jgi:hypothetical protein
MYTAKQKMLIGSNTAAAAAVAAGLLMLQADAVAAAAAEQAHGVGLRLKVKAAARPRTGLMACPTAVAEQWQQHAMHDRAKTHIG